MSLDDEYLDAYRLACFGGQAPLALTRRPTPRLCADGHPHHFVQNLVAGKAHCIRGDCGYSVSVQDLALDSGWRPGRPW